jgi:hypothetical protein
VEMNGINQVIVYTDKINFLGENINTIKNRDDI